MRRPAAVALSLSALAENPLEPRTLVITPCACARAALRVVPGSVGVPGPEPSLGSSGSRCRARGVTACERKLGWIQAVNLVKSSLPHGFLAVTYADNTPEAQVPPGASLDRMIPVPSRELTSGPNWCHTTSATRRRGAVGAGARAGDPMAGQSSWDSAPAVWL